MIEITRNIAVVNFSYTGEGCTASGDYKVEDGVLKHIGIAGSFTQGGETYAFTAERDDNANIVVAGVPASVLQVVAQAVAVIVSEVEPLVSTEE